MKLRILLLVTAVNVGAACKTVTPVSAGLSEQQTGTTFLGELTYDEQRDKAIDPYDFALVGIPSEDGYVQKSYYLPIQKTSQGITAKPDAGLRMNRLVESDTTIRPIMQHSDGDRVGKLSVGNTAIEMEKHPAVVTDIARIIFAAKLETTADAKMFLDGYFPKISGGKGDVFAEPSFLPSKGVDNISILRDLALHPSSFTAKECISAEACNYEHPTHGMVTLQTASHKHFFEDYSKAAVAASPTAVQGEKSEYSFAEFKDRYRQAKADGKSEVLAVFSPAWFHCPACKITEGQVTSADFQSKHPSTSIMYVKLNQSEAAKFGITSWPSIFVYDFMNNDVATRIPYTGSSENIASKLR